MEQTKINVQIQLVRNVNERKKILRSRGSKCEQIHFDTSDPLLCRNGAIFHKKKWQPDGCFLKFEMFSLHSKVAFILASGFLCYSQLIHQSQSANTAKPQIFIGNPKTKPKVYYFL